MGRLEELAMEMAEVDETGMSRVSQLALQQNDLETEIKELAGQGKEVKAQLKNLAEQVFPALMQELNLKEITTENGILVKVAGWLSAKIPENRVEEAHQWLEDNDYGDLITCRVTIELPRTQVDQGHDLLKELQERGLAASLVTNVHHQTLLKFLRTAIEEGEAIPLDLFGVKQGNQTKIKATK